MMPVTGYQQFLDLFCKLENRSRLFMFVLFDARPSHHAVETFVDANFGWLDNLAAATNMFGFAFLEVDEVEGVVRNPSLQVASNFGIHANGLPGVVAFTMLPESPSVNKAVYLPIEAKLFAEEQEVVENVFADLFSVFQKALDETDNDEELISEIKEEFESIAKREKRRPILEFIGRKALSLVDLPEKLLEATAISFGKTLGTRLGE